MIAASGLRPEAAIKVTSPGIGVLKDGRVHGKVYSGREVSWRDSDRTQSPDVRVGLLRELSDYLGFDN